MENQAAPRFFDVWILPAFMVGYAIKSREMSRKARRLLCIAGLYMGFRNMSKYKAALLAAQQKYLSPKPQEESA